MNGIKDERNDQHPAENQLRHEPQRSGSRWESLNYRGRHANLSLLLQKVSETFTPPIDSTRSILRLYNLAGHSLGRTPVQRLVPPLPEDKEDEHRIADQISPP